MGKDWKIRADSQLTQVLTLGRTGYLLLVEQGVEDHQRVEIDTPKIVAGVALIQFSATPETMDVVK